MTFSVLTDAQGATLRNTIGDTDTDDPKLSDTVLDSIYTEANLDLDCAAYAALKQLIGIYAMHVSIGGATQVAEQRGERVKNLERQRDYFAGLCSSAGTPLSIGTFDHNLDTDYDDLGLT